MKAILCTVLILLLSSSLCATDFYSTGRKGWFWYQSMDVKKKKTKKEKVKPATSPKKDISASIDWKAVWTMPAEQFQELVKKTLNKAVTNPTQKNVEDYIKLQYVAKERAKKFQRAWAEVLLKHPLLDENAKRSPTTVGSLVESSALYTLKRDVIDDMRENMGLVFFYSPGCGYCKKEEQILDDFLTRWQWNNILAVNIKERPDLADHFGVELVPDLFLVAHLPGGDKVMRVGAGLLTQSTIEERLVDVYYRLFKRRPFERPELAPTLKNFNDIVEDNDG